MKQSREKRVWVEYLSETDVGILSLITLLQWYGCA